MQLQVEITDGREHRYGLSGRVADYMLAQSTERNLHGRFLVE